MVVGELLGGLAGLGGGGGACLLAEGGHEFVVVGALDLHLAEVGGVALHLDGLAGLGEDGLLGEIGEDEHEGGGFVAGYGVDEAASVDADGVYLLEDAVGAVDVELALVEVFELSLEFERAAAGEAGGKQKRE